MDLDVFLLQQHHEALVPVGGPGYDGVPELYEDEGLLQDLREAGRVQDPAVLEGAEAVVPDYDVRLLLVDRLVHQVPEQEARGVLLRERVRDRPLQVRDELRQEGREGDRLRLDVLVDLLGNHVGLQPRPVRARNLVPLVLVDQVVPLNQLNHRQQLVENVILVVLKLLYRHLLQLSDKLRIVSLLKHTLLAFNQLTDILFNLAHVQLMGDVIVHLI